MSVPIPYTCPDIDSIIADLKEQSSELQSALNKIDPCQYSDYHLIMPDLISSMENVKQFLEVYRHSSRWGRETNPLELLRQSNDTLRRYGEYMEEQRDQLDDQVSTLEAEVESLEYQLKQSEQKREELEKDTDHLEKTNSAYLEEINQLKASLMMYIK